MAETKICTKCGKLRDKTLFLKNPHMPDGLVLYCNICREQQLLKTVACTKCKKVKPKTAEYYYIFNGKCAARCKKCFKKYRQANYDHYIVLADRRRAKIKEYGGSFTEKDIYRLLDLQQYKCLYCGQELKKYHIDHFIPITKGGTSDPSNLVISCPHCNMKKSSKWYYEWDRWNGQFPVYPQ